MMNNLLPDVVLHLRHAENIKQRSGADPRRSAAAAGQGTSSHIFSSHRDWQFKNGTKVYWVNLVGL